MLMNPSLMLEVSTAACLVKEEALERSGWFKGSGEKRQVPYVVTSYWVIFSVSYLATKKLRYGQ